MEKIASFKVNHTDLKPGIYISRVDEVDNSEVTTYDIRMRAPRDKNPISLPALHVIEHVGATFMRNSPLSDQVVYFGPMGCGTGFYVILKKRLHPNEVRTLVKECFKPVLEISKVQDIPGASTRECGSPFLFDISEAKEAVRLYLEYLEKEFNFKYPD